MLGRLTQEFLFKEGLGHVREAGAGFIAIRIPGHHAFAELTDCLLDRYPVMARGVTFTNIEDELFNFIEQYIGCDSSAVTNKDARSLMMHFEGWFAEKIVSRRVFVPCVISRISAPRFEIGPVVFEFVEYVMTSDFYPHRRESGDDEFVLDRHGFDELMRWMRERDANWLARVSVDGCDQKRAEEIAELAVDLVIVALQIAAPHLDTRTMARLDARRGTSRKRTLSEVDGNYSVGWSLKEPGLAIGHGTLPDILTKAAPVFTAVGNVVRSFTSGSFRLIGLERAWCDAAYWLHQGLAESIDTIAIAKLETALEVLVRAESSKGSERRVIEILGAFFDLGPDDPSAPGSRLSSRQFARNVVRDRSCILHGTWSTLNARGVNRAGMEGFVTAVLRMAVIELDAYAHSSAPTDNIDQFLDWVRWRRGQSVPSI